MDSKDELHRHAARRSRTRGVEFPLGSVTADGNFMFRTIYSLMCQQGGELLTDGEFLAGDNAEKLQTRCRSAGLDQGRAAVDLHRLSRDRGALHLGKAAMMINGVWEVPTMTDLAKQGKLFDWGAVETPGHLRPALHLCRQPHLRDPDQPGQGR